MKVDSVHNILADEVVSVIRHCIDEPLPIDSDKQSGSFRCVGLSVALCRPKSMKNAFRASSRASNQELGWPQPSQARSD